MKEYINTTIKRAEDNDPELDLISFTTKDLSKDQLISLLIALKNNTHVKILTLYGPNHALLASKYTVEVLEKRPELKVDSIFGDTFDSDTIHQLSAMLQNNKSITHLNLNYNNLDHKDALIISEALKKNETLTHLSLFSNNFKDSGVIEIAKLIRVNTTLLKIDLRINGITDQGVGALAHALRVNHTLKSLDISWNYAITPEGEMLITKAEKRKQHTSKINVSTSSEPAVEITVVDLFSEQFTAASEQVSDIKENIEETRRILNKNRLYKAISGISLSILFIATAFYFQRNPDTAKNCTKAIIQIGNSVFDFLNDKMQAAR